MVVRNILPDVEKLIARIREKREMKRVELRSTHVPLGTAPQGEKDVVASASVHPIPTHPPADAVILGRELAKASSPGRGLG